MSRMITCPRCGEYKQHHSKGLCKACCGMQWRKDNSEYMIQYYQNNKEQICQQHREYRGLHGGKSMSENKSCTVYLGCHIAEQVLSKIFKVVEVMPYGNMGYDFICGKGYKIDVKSGCIVSRDNRTDRWGFIIAKNTIPDYFLCLAFDNREDLNPLHIWLIPSNVLNKLTFASICMTTLSRWDEYRLDINKVITCCDNMKNIIYTGDE